MSSADDTIAYYQREAARYVNYFAYGHSRDLDGFLDRLKPAGKILELGCGGGRDSLRIAERGFAIDVTDGTPAMAAEARRKTGLPVRVMRFDEISAHEEYDAVWAHACLLHAPRADLPGILGAVFTALKPGGWHFANYKLGSGEGPDPLGRLTNFPSAEWLEDAYRSAGFTLEDVKQYVGEGADGVVRDWLALTVRKPK